MSEQESISPTSFIADSVESELYQVPGVVVKVESKANRSLRIVVDTQENLSDSQMARTMQLIERFGWFVHMPRKIEPEDVVKLPPLQLEADEKSPSQRLRAVLYVYYEQKKPTPTFDQFYRESLERFISNVKEKLT